MYRSQNLVKKNFFGIFYVISIEECGNFDWIFDWQSFIATWKFWIFWIYDACHIYFKIAKYLIPASIPLNKGFCLILSSTHIFSHFFLCRKDWHKRTTYYFDDKKFFLLEIKIFFSNILCDNGSLKFNFFVLEKNFFQIFYVNNSSLNFEKLEKNLLEVNSIHFLEHTKNNWKIFFDWTSTVLPRICSQNFQIAVFKIFFHE